MNPLNKVISLHINGILQNALVTASVLKLDQQLTDRPKSIIELAHATNTKPEALEKILLVLSAHDIIHQVSENSYQASELTPWLKILNAPNIIEGDLAIGNGLLHTLRTNDNAFTHIYGKSFYQYLAANPQKITDFDHWCHLTACNWLEQFFSLYDFSKFHKLIDIAGGKGYFLSEFLRHNQTATGILFDHPKVVEKASLLFETYNLLSRVEFLGGDFFSTLPSGGDAYTLCRTLLNWHDDQASKILNNCYSVMSQQSKLIIIDFIIPNKDHSQYKAAVQLNLRLFAIFESAIRSETQWLKLIHQTKFKVNRLITTSEKNCPNLLYPMCLLEITR